MWLGLTADLAPSISQSVVFRSSDRFIIVAFAGQVPGPSRRYKCFAFRRHPGKVGEVKPWTREMPDAPPKTTGENAELRLALEAADPATA
jgi:hypothetical protein